jgi:aryl-alcohol dehydrogenase-like predicted oxidoreductase
VGSSGLQVSRIGLGTMTWGDDTDGDAAAEQLRVFVQSGGTLVETADGYGGGIALDVLAGLLRRAVSRDDLVLAGRSLLADGPHGSGAGRGALLGGLDRLLRRLGTDYLDLWQIPGWDPDVPLDEPLAVADAAVASGRVRYVGLVGPAGWQFATAAERARARWPSAVPTSVQAEYSLLARDAEAELLPAAAHHAAGLLAWAPLGRGVLTGTYADAPAVSPYVEERAPLLASVVGLMVLGILHNVLELRYVLARWRGRFTGSFRVTVVALVTVIALARLAGPQVRRVEVVAGFAVLAAGMAYGARNRPVLAAAGLPLTAVATVLAWTHLDLYFVAVTYLHNLVPFVFLWDWSTRRLRPGAARAAFRAVQVGWLLVVPALLLFVVHVPAVAAQARLVRFAGPVAAHVATAVPPGWRGPGAARWLAVFAFLQVLHYAFWCVFLPRHAGAVSRSARPAWQRRAGWAAAGVTAVVFASGYATAWTSTRLTYTALASYHAYVELAVLALVVFRPTERARP